MGDRWNVDQYYNPDPAPGKMYTREGGFLDDIGDFDAEVFNISAQEACWTDQHRLLLEVSWEALDDAGIFLDPFYSPGSDFIAFANTFLSDLIGRDLSGQSYRFRAYLYDRIFKKFFYGTAAVYQDQYTLFGNQQVMPVKIMWDYLVYWSLSGFVFMHGRLCDQFMYPRNMFKLTKLSKMNHFMQDFFRRWHQQSPGQEVNGAVDTTSMPLIFETNERLLADLDNRAFNRQFSDNVAQIETLFWEIIDAAGVDVDEAEIPVKRRHHPRARRHAFQHVFEVTARQPQDLEAERTGVTVVQ